MEEKMKKLLTLLILMIATLFASELLGTKANACQVTCPNGSTIACENPPCSAGTDWVKCGGTTLSCP
jgi:hypothetical protein